MGKTLERQILIALVAKKLETMISDFVAEHSSAIAKLEMEPGQIAEFLWELTGEAVTLRQSHVSGS